MAKSYYELAPIAENDMEDVFGYSFDAYGMDQAARYFSELEDIFDMLKDNPAMEKARNEIREGLRSFVHKQHIIYYRILKDYIRIVRVLHVSRDALTLFGP